ncbi:hypothetical protein Esti_006285 [Eimeria stiedai]
MRARLAVLLTGCLAVAAAAAWKKLAFPDLSAVENLYAVIAKAMSRPQYFYHLHNLPHFRERSNVAMGDFVMREAQPVAFKAAWSLDASYPSRAAEDGEESWGAAPRRAAADILTYDEMYVEGKLQAPSDPASVIIDRPHSFSSVVAPQLLPPHPTDESPFRDDRKLPRGTKQKQIGLQLYVPLTCKETPEVLREAQPEAHDACRDKHESLLSTLSQLEGTEGFSSLQIQLEAKQLGGEEEAGKAASARPLRPVLFYVHGGGLVSLSTAAYDKLVRRMANLMGAEDGVVVSVDYRLSPEHKFPAPLEDCLHAISFVVKHAETLGLDATRLAVIGDSAGGSLTASLLAEALRLPRKYPWIDSVQHAALVYPSLCRGCPTRSHLLYGDISTLKNDIWFAFAHTQVLGPVGDWRQIPFAIPSELLSRFPPTSLILFTHDIQYEVGVLFHERLRRAGVKTSLFIAPEALGGGELSASTTGIAIISLVSVLLNLKVSVAKFKQYLEMRLVMRTTGMHGFFGSDAWSTFGVRAVEWTIERILNSMQKVAAGGSRAHLERAKHNEASVNAGNKPAP